MTDEIHEKRLNDHKLFYCPKGHSMHYAGKSKAEKLQEEVNNLRREIRETHSIAEMNLKRWIHEERRRTGYQGLVKKLQKQIAELKQALS